MIFDHIRNRARYRALSPAIAEALDFCADVWENGFTEGDFTTPAGAVMKCHPMLTRTPEKIVFETHYRLLDIHFIAEGREVIAYADRAGLTVSSDSPENDLTLLDGEGTPLTLEAGYFMLVFPEDAHAPGLAADTPAQVKKIVAKLPVPEV